MSAESILPAPAEKLLNDFDQKLTGLLGLEASPTRPESSIHHYTDANGLLGILRDQQLWMTDSTTMNDPSESKYTLRKVDEKIRPLLQSPSLSVLEGVFWPPIIGKMPSIVENNRVFLTSFSKAANNLSQWRLYGSDGAGFSIGLTPNAFELDDRQRDRANISVVVVSYDEQALERRINDGIAATRALLDSLDRSAVSGTFSKHDVLKCLPRAAVLFTSFILSTAIEFKHPAYSDEKEVRLITAFDMDQRSGWVKFRERRGAVIPFVTYRFEVDLCKEGVLDEIWVGPKATQEAAANVELLLRSSGYKNVTVQRSDIPYR